MPLGVDFHVAERVWILSDFSVPDEFIEFLIAMDIRSAIVATAIGIVAVIGTVSHFILYRSIEEIFVECLEIF